MVAKAVAAIARALGAAKRKRVGKIGATSRGATGKRALSGGTSSTALAKAAFCCEADSFDIGVEVLKLKSPR